MIRFWGIPRTGSCGHGEVIWGHSTSGECLLRMHEVLRLQRVPGKKEFETCKVEGNEEGV